MEKDDTFTTDPNQKFHFAIRQGQRQREVVIAVGMQVVVDPFNPRKKKHRGRIGHITKIRLDYIGTPMSANVTFQDRTTTGSWGVVDVGDLRPPTAEEKASLAQGA